MSVEVGYTRRWLQHFVVTRQPRRDRGGFRHVQRHGAGRPRLPGGGGYVVSGLYDVNLPSAASRTSWPRSTDLLPGARRCSTSATTALLVDVSARPRNGLSCSRAASTRERRSRTTVTMRAILPEIGPLNPYCHNEPGFITRVDRPGVLHDSEGGRQPERDRPERSGRAAAGELVGAAMRRSCRRSGRSLSAQPAIRDRQSRHAWRRLGRPGQRDRHPHRQDPAVRPNARRTSGSTSSTSSTLRRS